MQASGADSVLPDPEHDPATAERRARIFGGADLSTGRSLEIGPLDAALLTRDIGEVYYADVRDRAGTVAYYRDDASVRTDLIPEIDFWLTRDDGTVGTLAEAVAAAAPFRRVVASHVIEHVPDMIGWLADVADVLDDDGELVLVVPDLRFCFDALRPGATVGQVLQAHQDGDRVPSIRAVYDFARTAVPFPAASAWDGAWPPEERVNPMPRVSAMVERQRRGEYVDCHVWPVTPVRFVDIFADLLELGLIDLAVERVTATPHGHHEFYATLRRFPRDGARDEMATSALRHLSRVRDSLPDEVRTWPQQVREARLVEQRLDLERQLGELEAEAARTAEERDSLRLARDRAWEQRNRAREERDLARAERNRSRERARQATRERDRARARAERLAGQLRRGRARLASRLSRAVARRLP